MSFFVHETIYRNLAPAADQLITVCGAGALGANLAETLARMGLRQLRVIDRDRVVLSHAPLRPDREDQTLRIAQGEVDADHVAQASASPGR